MNCDAKSTFIVRASEASIVMQQCRHDSLLSTSTSLGTINSLLSVGMMILFSNNHSLIACVAMVMLVLSCACCMAVKWLRKYFTLDGPGVVLASREGERDLEFSFHQEAVAYCKGITSYYDSLKSKCDKMVKWMCAALVLSAVAAVLIVVCIILVA